MLKLRTSVTNKTVKVEDAVSKTREHPLTEIYSNSEKWLTFKHVLDAFPALGES